jgi:hypothetical protein
MAKHTPAPAAHIWCHLLESPLILAHGGLKLSMSNPTGMVCPCLSLLSAQYHRMSACSIRFGYRVKRFVNIYEHQPLISLWSSWLWPEHRGFVNIFRLYFLGRSDLVILDSRHLIRMSFIYSYLQCLHSDSEWPKLSRYVHDALR